MKRIDFWNNVTYDGLCDIAVKDPSLITREHPIHAIEDRRQPDGRNNLSGLDRDRRLGVTKMTQPLHMRVKVVL